MWPRRLAGALVCSSVLVLLGAVPAAAGTVALQSVTTYEESFENGFGEWTPATDGLARDWSITWQSPTTALPPKEGTHQLLYFIDGSRDDGTIWVERPIDLPDQGESGVVQVDVSFWLASSVISSINNWPVVAYAGQSRPTSERDLTIVGETDQVAGWKQYTFSKSFPAAGLKRLWVACGLSATWEVSRSYPIDLIEVTVKTA